ncbi:MAG: hypothetical protein WCW27_03120 [Patescibacteria group bacterium]|jgi:hypothetical protein
MNKQCKNCNKTFKITDQDLAFYEKINVSIPTHCPDCRLQRRLAWRNERTLYARTCDLCHKKILALYPKNSSYKVYCHDCYWGDSWSGLEDGREFDFDKPFFEQYTELIKKLPHPAAYNDQIENSEYINYCYGAKNCYLLFGSDENEDCYYCTHVKNCVNCIDCITSDHLELCSNCVDCSYSYNTHYAQESHQLRDCYFNFDCKNCSNCFGSAGLRNKQFILFNKQVSAEEYHKQVDDMLKKHTVAELYKMAEQTRLKNPCQPAIIIASHNSSGDHLHNCSNAQQCFDSNDIIDAKYIYYVNGKAFDCMDVYGGGFNYEQCYEFIVGIGHNLHFSMLCWKSVYNIAYSILTNNAHDCFGCFSLKTGQYAIFNKQYSASDYSQLKNKIIHHMKQTGEWGEFFPVEKSIFAYNETNAQIEFPLNKTTVQQRNWRWTDTIYVTTGKETADINKTATFAPLLNNNITKNIYKCSTCERNFKILGQEFIFYQRQKIFIPVDCYECRFVKLYKKRNSYQIWHRQCMCTQIDHNHQGRCATEFETTYAPDRKELIYCEQCYQKEIY